MHRVFRQNIDSGKPVIINTGDLYYQYQYSPNHKTFEDGLKLMEGDDKEIKDRFLEVVRKFGLDIAISEGGYVKNNDGSLSKVSPENNRQESSRFSWSFLSKLRKNN